MKLRDRFSRFMYGRYGVDQFSKFMLVVTFILCIISLFVSGAIGSIISLLVLVLIVLLYFRMFSKNTYKRAAENEKYMRMTGGIRKKFNTEKNIASQRKYYRFYNCPRCNQKIRVPKGHGKIEIRCPKCGEKFIKKS